MGSFYSRLSYSFGNEDWETERQALDIQPDDQVLCVSASGDRPLNLLSRPCKSMVCIDANPIQNAMLDLKKTAMVHLEPSEYLAFIGLQPSKDRLKTFSEIKTHLDDFSVRYWEKHQRSIAKGALFEGAVEKWLKFFSKAIRLLRGRKVPDLFAFDDVDKQAQFVDDVFITTLWRKTFHWSMHPWLTRLFIKDPSLYAYVDPSLHLGERIFQQMHNYLRRGNARKSYLLSLMLMGKVYPEALPPYLLEKSVRDIKERVPLITIENTDLISYLEQAPDNQFDCFSCSDVASYISRKQFSQLLSSMQRVAKPGAKFCIRQCFSNHEIPKEFESSFHRDYELEKKLEAEESCFVYQFMVGRIKK